MAVASNPNLDREQWVRALELAPQAAVRNPLMQLMMVGGTPIIQHDYEVVALGILAACAMQTPPCSIEREALVDIICMGLEPAFAEQYGAYDQERFDDNQHASLANRYCWNESDMRDRANALHSAGRVIIDVLRGSTHTRSAQALKQCRDFGEHLCAEDLDGAGELDLLYWILFAPRGKCEFTHELLVISEYSERYPWGSENGELILGWSERGAEVVWLREVDQPGFIPGRVRRSDELPPSVIQESFGHYVNDAGERVSGAELRWSCTHMTENETYDFLYFDLLSSGVITRISQGYHAQDGCAELADCMLGKPFPVAEISRLSKLFGSDSAVVRFAQSSSNHGGTCPECHTRPFIRFPGFTCDSCLFEYKESDESDDVEDE